MKHHALRRRGLYAITDGPRRDLLDVVEQALAGGVVLLQYRDKASPASRRLREARALRTLCARYDVPLIINDDVALCAAIGADGVHLGRSDWDLSTARSVLGRKAIIGVSCYDDIRRARALAAAGADYVAFGAFFPSTTKPTARRAAPELLRQSAALGLPRVAIGGITPDNGASLVDAGADFLAVISGLFGAADVGATARRYATLFDQPETDAS